MPSVYRVSKNLYHFNNLLKMQFFRYFIQMLSIIFRCFLDLLTHFYIWLISCTKHIKLIVDFFPVLCRQWHQQSFVLVHFFANVYLDLLTEYVTLKLNDLQETIIFQQDGAPLNWRLHSWYFN